MKKLFAFLACALSIAGNIGLAADGVNLLANAGFERGFAGWSRTAGWSIDPAVSYSGAGSARCEIPWRLDSYICQGYDFGADIAGREFVASVWIKTENVARVWLRTYWKDADGRWIWRNMESASISGTAGWTRLRATGKAPPGATQAWLFVAPVVKDGRGVFWVDDCAIEPVQALDFRVEAGPGPLDLAFQPELWLPLPIAGYEWDFNGDGLTDSLLEAPVHTFPAPGEHRVGLRVTTAGGAAYETERTVRIPSRLAIAAEWTETDGFVLRTSPPDAEIAMATWTFGDGCVHSGPERRVVHAYRNGGSYLVLVEAVSTDGAAAGAEIAITAPPSIEAAPTASSDGITVTFAANAVAHYGGRITEAVWDCGDGSRVRGEEAIHVYPAPGTYQPVLTLTDSFGHTRVFAAPSVTMAAGLALNLADGQLCRGSLNLRGAVDGEAEAESIALLLDGEVAAEAAAAAIEWTWNTHLTSNGTHAIGLRAIMADGSICERTVAVTVANPIHRLTVTGPQ